MIQIIEGPREVICQSDAALNALRTPQQADVEVGMWQTVSGRGQMNLETTGLCPCLGIAVMDTRTGVAVVGHYPNPTLDKGFENALQRRLFQDTVPPSPYARVVLAGCSSVGDEPEMERFSGEAAREMVIDQLVTAGYRAFEVCWATGSEVLSLRVECEKRSIAVRSFGEMEASG